LIFSLLFAVVESRGAKRKVEKRIDLESAKKMLKEFTKAERKENYHKLMMDVLQELNLPEHRNDQKLHPEKVFHHLKSLYRSIQSEKEKRILHKIKKALYEKLALRKNKKVFKKAFKKISHKNHENNKRHFHRDQVHEKPKSKPMADHATNNKRHFHTKSKSKANAVHPENEIRLINKMQ